MTEIGFIGCGNMGGALVKAAANAGYLDSIYICDHFAEKTDALSKELGVHVSDSVTIAKECDFIFMGHLQGICRDKRYSRKQRRLRARFNVGRRCD